jgi:hypothetical protein
MSEKVAKPDKYALENDLIIVLPQPTQLQLDIDAKQLPKGFQEQLGILGQVNPVLSYKTTESKSGNMHVIVELSKEVTPLERVLLQACLGSDIKRELLTYLNLQDPKNMRPQFLFEKNHAVAAKPALVAPYNDFDDLPLAELERAA